MILSQNILSGYETHRYQLQFAKSNLEIDHALKLRYDIFNLELRRGFSFGTDRDKDPYDDQFHHLLVREKSGDIIGTYRLQTWEQAADGLGFYTGKRFDMDQLPDSIKKESVEVGRACIRKDHRSGRVLFLLWKGIAAYMQHFNKRYLFGSSAITSTDPALGWHAYSLLKENGNLHPKLNLPVREPFATEKPAKRESNHRDDKLPSLFQNYLDVGCSVCGGPAFDSAAASIYFVTLLDLQDISDRTRKMFFG